MATTMLKLSARKLDPNIKYCNPNQVFMLGEEPEGLSLPVLKEKMDFFIPTLKREVKKLNKDTIKKYTKICVQTLGISLSLLALASPSLAAPIEATTKVVEVISPDLAKSSSDLIMPGDIAKIGLYLIGLGAVVSTVLAILLTQFAGGYRMLRKGKEASEWTTDILKGYTQVILAPVIILSIAFVVYLLFGSFKWFVKPF